MCFSWEYFIESGHTEYKQKCPHNLSVNCTSKVRHKTFGVQFTCGSGGDVIEN